jgi:hypothetical protein
MSRPSYLEIFIPPRAAPPPEPELPLCSICKRPVDRLESWRDERERVTRYRVFCHGESQDFAVEDRAFGKIKLLRLKQPILRDRMHSFSAKGIEPTEAYRCASLAKQRSFFALALRHITTSD